MELRDALGALAASGTTRNRVLHARHGVQGPSYGVSTAAITKLARRTGVDHALALALWDTGNHDARVLATRVADPDRVTVKLADRWVRDCDNDLILEQLVDLLAGTRVAAGRSASWRDRRNEWIAAAGWALTAALIGTGEIGDEECAHLLGQIEREIHGRPNRVRHEMNATVISIGMRGAWLQTEALDAAARIGRVEVDHGATSCRTPDAVEQIERAIAQRAPAAPSRARQSARR